MVAEFRLLTAAYGLLVVGMTMKMTGGSLALAAVTLSFACLVAAGVLRVRVKGDTGRKTEHWPLACALLLAMGIGWSMIFLNGPASLESTGRMIFFRHIVFALIVLAYLTPLGRRANIRLSLFAAVMIIVAAQLFLVPSVSPAPVMDVHGMGQWAGETLLSGRNPYVETMPNLYGEAYEAAFGAVDHYVYPPAALYPQVAAYAVLGDVRYASVIGMLIFCLCLWLFGANVDGRLRELLILAFIANPMGIFIVEQAWTEPVLLAVFAIAVLLKARGRWSGAFAAFGYALAMKQYVLFTVPAMLLLGRKERAVIVMGLVGFATLLPFLLWDAHSVIQNGILFQLGNSQLRYDSFNYAPHFAAFIGTGARRLTMVVGLLAIAGTTYLFRRGGLCGFLYAASIVLFATFLFGGVAFVNYYYGVAGLILLTLAVSARADRSAL